MTTAPKITTWRLVGSSLVVPDDKPDFENFIRADDAVSLFAALEAVLASKEAVIAAKNRRIEDLGGEI